MGDLQIGQVNVSELVEDHRTPLYVYDGGKIREQYRRLANAFDSEFESSSVNYAVKANPNPSILSILSDEGCGLTVPVSQR